MSNIQHQSFVGADTHFFVGTNSDTDRYSVFHSAEWVLKNVGNIDEFLMTTLVSQSNDSDFLSMKPVEQRSHLEKLLGLRVANSKANLFKQAFSITKSFKTNLDICLGENSNDSENVDELQAINAIYNAKKSLLKNLSSSLTNSWGNCKILKMYNDIIYLRKPHP